MKATFKILNSYFWKSGYGPIFSFLFPAVLLIVMGGIMRLEYVLPGIIACAVMFIGVLAMPTALMEIKNSSLSKYIGVSPVDSKKFSASIILFYIIISFTTTLLLIAISAAVWHEKIANEKLFSGLATPIGGAGFALAMIIHIVFSLTLGLLISTFATIPQTVLTLGIIIIIPAMFLSGMVLSVDVIARSSIMQWLSRLIPFRYSTANLVIAFTPSNQLGVLKIDPDNLLGIKLMTSDKYYEAFVSAADADNNIFNWSSPWGVKKIPDMDKVMTYFVDYVNLGKSGEVPGSWDYLVDKVNQSDYSWITTFLRQSVTLYQPAERTLNILLPIGLSVIFAQISVLRFKWSTR